MQILHEVFEVTGEVVDVDEALDLNGVLFENLETGLVVDAHLLEHGLDARGVQAIKLHLLVFVTVSSSNRVNQLLLILYISELLTLQKIELERAKQAQGALHKAHHRPFTHFIRQFALALELL